MTVFYKPVFATLVLLSLITAGCATAQQGTRSSTGGTGTDTDSGSETGTVSPYQLDRPVPNKIDNEIPYPYTRAVREGTRSASGKPGPRYWRQQADYVIDAELIPAEKRVSASSTITYHNNSPDSLRILVLELAQNVHAEGAARNESTEITGGIELESVRIAGRELPEIERQGQRGYLVDGTRLFINSPREIRPDRSIELEIDWSFTVPQSGASGRMGYSNDNLFFIAYWYPQVAVYDDVFGWFTDNFTNNAEFYHEFGDYTVNITAPRQWLVRATGELQNGDEVLAPDVWERYRLAQRSDSTVTIAGQNDIGNITTSGRDGKLTWSFTADMVNDFAFSVTKESNWDGARTPVGDRDGDGTTDYTFVDALYRTSAPKWSELVGYAQHSIRFLSDFTGLPYPWPHMTSVEGAGIIGGGMEFPMMTLMGSYNYSSPEALYYVTAHEFAHMWVPMMVSTNERRYSWMDEGTTTFHENQARKDYFTGSNNPDLNEFQSYIRLAGTYLEGPIMRWSDYHYPGPAYGTASYSKPATGLVILRNLLGEETFMKAHRTYLEAWQYKHPYPWDLFHIFESVSGRDLDWFWRSFYYETWVLDQAVAEVTPVAGGTGTRIVIEDRGQIPLPAEVRITLANGREITRTIPVETWLSGKTRAELQIESGSGVERVAIDPDHQYPDVNRSNNTWSR